MRAQSLFLICFIYSTNTFATNCKDNLSEEAANAPVSPSKETYTLTLRIAALKRYLFENVFHYRAGSGNSQEYTSASSGIEHLLANEVPKLKAHGESAIEALLSIALDHSESLETRRTALELLTALKSLKESESAVEPLLVELTEVVHSVEHATSLHASDPSLFPHEGGGAMPAAAPAEIRGFRQYSDNEKLLGSLVDALSVLGAERKEVILAFEALLLKLHELAETDPENPFFAPSFGGLRARILESLAGMNSPIADQALENHLCAAMAFESTELSTLIRSLISMKGLKPKPSLLKTLVKIYAHLESQMKTAIQILERDSIPLLPDSPLLIVRFSIGELGGFIRFFSETLQTTLLSSLTDSLRLRMNKVELTREDWYFIQVYGDSFLKYSQLGGSDLSALDAFYETIHRLTENARTGPPHAAGIQDEYSRPEDIYRVLNYTVSVLAGLGKRAYRSDPLLQSLAQDPHFGWAVNSNAKLFLAFSVSFF